MSALDQLVVYKGEEVQAIGTAMELSKALGMSLRDVRQLATPSRVKRADAAPDSLQLFAVRVPAAELQA